MGNSYILQVYDDAVRDLWNDTAVSRVNRRIAETLLFSLCRNRHARESDSVSWESGNANMNRAATLVDEVRSSSEQVYLWAGNCLRSYGELPDDRLRDILRIVERELEARNKRRAEQDAP